MESGSREDLYVVTVSVDFQGETRRLGTFDTFEGGEVSAEDTKYARGGLAEEESLGGRRHVGNVTVARLYDDFMQQQEPWLDSTVGKGWWTVTKQPLDESGNSFGTPRVYRGKCINMTPPNHDSMSSGEARISFEISAQGPVG